MFEMLLAIKSSPFGKASMSVTGRLPTFQQTIHTKAYLMVIAIPFLAIDAVVNTNEADR